MDFDKETLSKLSKVMLVLYALLIFATVFLASLLVVLDSVEKRESFSCVNRTVSDTDFLNLSQKDREYLVSVAYTAVTDFFSGNVSGGGWPDRFDGVNRKVFVGFRVKGKKSGSWSALRDNLAESVYVAAKRTLLDRRYGSPLTEEGVSELKIEVFILGDYSPLNNNYEPGIHGLRFEKDGKEATYYNSVAIEGNYGTTKLMGKLCKKANLPENCYTESSVKKYSFPTIHFATTRFTDEVVTFYRCNTPESKPNVSLEKLNTSLQLATGWLLGNINDDGFFTYVYNPSNGKYSSSNNMIRQLMASRLLAELSCADESLLPHHRKNLDYVFKNWYRERGDVGYIIYNSKSKLGANAMALRTLVYSPLFDEYWDKAKKLANSLLLLQNPDGSFEPWYTEPDYSYNKDYLLTFYSGEAVLALVECYIKTNNTIYLDAAIKSQDYYVERYVHNLEIYYYPAYVPWHTQSLNKLFKLTGDRRYAESIFILNDRLLEIQNQDGKPFMDYLGRFYNPMHPEYGTPHSSSDGVYTEGLAYAYEVAQLVNDTEHQDKYSKAIILGVHNLMNLQFRGPNMYYLQHPERVEGAIRYRVDDNRIRADTTQHTMDAFRKILNLFNEGDYGLK
ncbi:MAG: AMMECR1 domain-containing protein [Candidatus Altiarchaeota archaeon]|nr:AMMECR1 domain-containing protein [Candidatus Altiarchaeota archaeon]